MTACTSKIAQVRGNCFAQVRVSTTRSVTQQMRALLCEHLRSESFPNIDGKFIHCGQSGNQGDTSAGTQRSEIKLFSHALIWNCSYPVGNASSIHDWAMRLRSATVDSCRRTAGKFVCGQKSFREGMRDECSRSGFRTQIAFGMEL